jgi:hypothetical protein
MNDKVINKNEKSNLENFATTLKAKDHFIKASFGGFAGSGKSRTASELIKGVYKDLRLDAPLLIVDNEKGSRFLVKFFEDAGIKTYVKETVQLADIIAAFKLLNSGEVGFLFMDSLSKVWYQYVRDYKTVNKKTFMTLQDWGKILPSWQEMFSDRFVDLSGNCVFTGRGGYTYDMEVNEETKKKEFNKSGVKMKLAGETPFEPDINVWMEMQQEMKDGKSIVWREAQIMKDRSGLIDGKTFKNPTYKDFQPVVKYLLQIPTGEVAGETRSENLAPSENFESMNRRAEKEKLFDEIKGVFDLHGFGGTLGKEQKQLKVSIINSVFGTTSMERIQEFDNDILLNGKNAISDIFVELVDVEPESKLEFVKNYDLSKKEITVDNILSK